jgi:hypothetical protein
MKTLSSQKRVYEPRYWIGPTGKKSPCRGEERRTSKEAEADIERWKKIFVSSDFDYEIVVRTESVFAIQ